MYIEWVKDLLAIGMHRGRAGAVGHDAVLQSRASIDESETLRPYSPSAK